MFAGPSIWGSWSNFSDCNLSCGGGNQTRYRECLLNPDVDCPNQDTESLETQPCNTGDCKFNLFYTFRY